MPEHRIEVVWGEQGLMYQSTTDNPLLLKGMLSEVVRLIDRGANAKDAEATKSKIVVADMLTDPRLNGGPRRA